MKKFKVYIMFSIIFIFIINMLMTGCAPEEEIKIKKINNFYKTNYKCEIDDKITIETTISGDNIIASDISLHLSDKTAFDVDYNIVEGYVYYTITVVFIAKKSGKYNFYISNLDNSISSNTVNIEVLEKPKQEDNSPSQNVPNQPSNPEPDSSDKTETKPTPNAPSETSIIVYTTPTGKKYHYNKSCAGKNAIQSTKEKAVNIGLTPCKKCC